MPRPSPRTRVGRSLRSLRGWGEKTDPRSPQRAAGERPTQRAAGERPTIHEAIQMQTRGLVLVLGGVGGLDWCGFNMRRAARAARLPCAVESFRWGHGFGRWYADLTNVAHGGRQAERVADVIRRFRAEHAGEPVFVVGKSGGAGIVAWALERLGPEAVERAVLLSPALSPRYDLTAALRAVKRDMVVYWSPLDLVF